jgi:hypothetical protein
MTPAEIRDQLQQGKSLVEIATAKGITEDQLVAAILAPMQTRLQERVTEGQCTQAQVEARLQYAEQRVRQLVEANGLTYNNGLGYGRSYGCGGSGGTMGQAFGRDADDTPGANGNGADYGSGGIGRGMMGGSGTGFGGSGRGAMGRS